MNKTQLVDAIAKESELTKADSKKALDAIISSVSKSLKKGEKVTLIGFGTFSIKKRAARMGRNPQTGKPLKITARKIAKFKAGGVLTKAVK